MNTKEVEEKLKNIAEKLIGEVGEPTSDRAWSLTGEQFDQYGCHFKSFDVEDLLKKWALTIENIRQVAKLQLHRRYRYINDITKPKLFWRILPHIIEDPDKDMYNFRTRLLVTYNYDLDGSDVMPNTQEFSVEELAEGLPKKDFRGIQ